MIDLIVLHDAFCNWLHVAHALYQNIVCYQADDVPCWMLIGWVSQMTAILDKPESPAVHDLLIKIAQQYPMVCWVFYVLSNLKTTMTVWQQFICKVNDEASEND
jgi:hypothetical protein